jgi:hypothetical protein
VLETKAAIRAESRTRRRIRRTRRRTRRTRKTKSIIR